MDIAIRTHVAEWLKREYAKEFPDEITDDDVVMAITDSVTIWEGESDPRRWWNDVFRVTEIDGMLIGYWGAETTGDNSPGDCGWEFDPSTICQVEKKEIVTTVYERKKD